MSREISFGCAPGALKALWMIQEDSRLKKPGLTFWNSSSRQRESTLSAAVHFRAHRACFDASSAPRNGENVFDRIKAIPASKIFSDG
jgi:hypothetical protein